MPATAIASVKPIRRRLHKSKRRRSAPTADDRSLSQQPTAGHAKQLKTMTYRTRHHRCQQLVTQQKHILRNASVDLLYDISSQHKKVDQHVSRSH
ncbi:hypothetical protein F511_20031 [Dorcoceras hygrometricum]|uniref:Uncharacterized protein n=1 Tax=Dorcoceras hygrometricum TaxID=472368 RepID=A0A2Z7B8Q4_9LAMI|nr:hypothetical protein F511_20031 [Dorcoceras hygrometricum]